MLTAWGWQQSDNEMKKKKIGRPKGKPTVRLCVYLPKERHGHDMEELMERLMDDLGEESIGKLFARCMVDVAEGLGIEPPE